MRTVEIIGYKRANLGKKDAAALRKEGQVPCVLYGGGAQHHFHSPLILFRDLVYTPKPAFVSLNLEGEAHSCILQDIQFHPVSEAILHADFLTLREGRPIQMNIPVVFKGTSPGIQAGGKLLVKLRTLRVKALPEQMPEFIELDISELALGKSIKVNAVQQENFEVLNSRADSVATVEVPRTLKSQMSAAAEEEKA